MSEKFNAPMDAADISRSQAGHKLKNINLFIKNELDEIRHAFETDYHADDDYHNRHVTKGSSSSNTSSPNTLGNANSSGSSIGSVGAGVETQSVVIERQGGLANKFVLFLLLLWYLFSAFTLYTNKYIVSTGRTDPTIIGTMQMLVTSVCGYYQLKHTLWNKQASANQLITQTVSSLSKKKEQQYRSLSFWRNMFFIGLLRLISIVLGLMALKQAAISFVETVKSSSPIFTVVISQFMIGEITNFWTKVSLIPIMLGLALCSSFEINFSVFGFLAAIFTNFTECLQNVFSKLLLCSDHYKFTPLEVQFFSSVTSVAILIPLCFFTVDFAEQSFNLLNLLLFIINGLSFHCQTLLAFTLMSYISPVTHSVCNTLKRAFLIWFSVYIFQNQVGFMSAIGSILVLIGVLLYINVKNMSKQSKQTSMIKL